MLVWTAGCAQQLGDINRVSANALKKADFDSSAEWYIAQTFAEVPPASYAGFVGLGSSLEKIRWEITEDYLIAYRSYEHNPGARSDVFVDTEGNYHYLPDEQEGYSDEYKESPVAAYRILGHFDIQRQYNPSTGEQTNVIVENPSDRLWWETEYFRVDWTNVLASNILWDSYFTGNVSWYVQPSEESRDSLRMEYFDPNKIDYPDIAADDYPAGELYYLDFTNRMIVDPDYSYCWDHWYPFTLDDCAPSEVELRTSFLRVPAFSDYEPVVYDDIDQQKFGFFRTERLVYDRWYGERISGLVHLVNRFNIWRDTWQRNEDGSLRRDSDGRLVPRPFAERTPRPIAYHMSFDSPEELFPAFEAAGNEWDRSFRRAVAAAQGIANWQDVPQMFYVCHNPVIAEDDIPCGEVGLVAEIGDLRFNFMYWVDTPQQAGPLGYGPSTHDPETGEVITGTAYIYGAGVDTYSEYATQQVRFFNGDLDSDDLYNSDYVRENILARTDPNIDPRDMINPELANIRLEDFNIRDAMSERAQIALTRLERTQMRDLEFRPENHRLRWDTIANSGLGAMLVDQEMVNAFGVNTLNNLPAEVRDRYFQNGAFMPDALLARRENLYRMMEHNMTPMLETDDAILGLAQTYAGRTDYDQIRQELRLLILQALITHEVGHTIGLRHNFQGSWDSLNYQDRYWELKTEGVLGVNPSSGEIEVVPFHRPVYIADIYGMAKMTPAQITGRMREYQTTSIMDYHTYFNSDIHGIGKYDEAAILYGYTVGRDQTTALAESDPDFNTSERGYVEVFDNVGDARSIFESFDGLESPGYQRLLEQYHYATVVEAMATDGGDLPSDSAVAAQTMRDRIRNRHLMKYDEVMSQRENQVAGRSIEVPYMFLSDYWVGARQSCRAWDLGADPFEQVLNSIDQYEAYYPFYYFRRDRLDWGAYNVFYLLANYFFIDWVDNYQRFVYNIALYGVDDVIQENANFFSGYASVNTIGQVLMTPSYGSYYLDEAENAYILDSYSQLEDADLYIPMGQGRRYDTAYDPNMGYNYWVYPTEAGHFWAQYGATIVMTAFNSVQVRGADVSADFQSYLIPIYMLFEEEMTNMFNGLYTRDYSMIGARIVQEDHKVRLVPPVFAPLYFTDGSIMDPVTGEFVEADQVIGTPATEPTLETVYGYSQRVYPILYGMAFTTETNSLHFVDQANIFRVGSGEHTTPGEGFETVEYCDHFSLGGECYGALMPEGSENPGLAAQMVLNCIELQDQWDALELEASGPITPTRRSQIRDEQQDIAWQIQYIIEDMNFVRGIYDVFGASFY
ncbi:MAG: zinc-dependent metalloprotease [Bradymonadales bacterium]|nr:zinc-dependent metalloprotease [Bradymonadales bacterium]